jgi:hypothetical protein
MMLVTAIHLISFRMHSALECRWVERSEAQQPATTLQERNVL